MDDTKLNVSIINVNRGKKCQLERRPFLYG